MCQEAKNSLVPSQMSVFVGFIVFPDSKLNMFGILDSLWAKTSSLKSSSTDISAILAYCRFSVSVKTMFEAI